MADQKEQRPIRISGSRAPYIEDDTNLTIFTNMGVTGIVQIGSLHINEGKLDGESFSARSISLYDPVRLPDGVLAQSEEGKASIDGELGTATVKWLNSGFVQVTLITPTREFMFTAPASFKFM